MARMILLTEWAKRTFPTPPCKATLLNYGKNGAIVPPPVRAGRSMVVVEDAVFVGMPKTAAKKTDSPLLKRILSDG